MIAYTDGSAHPNPGPGGFGVVFLDDGNNLIATHSQGKINTTNNEMELAAIIYAAEMAATKSVPLTIYSDSAYAINCLTKWMYSWEQNGWRKGDKTTPENLHLIKYFFNHFKNADITFQKVKGHEGNKYNEMADRLATSAR